MHRFTAIVPCFWIAASCFYDWERDDAAGTGGSAPGGAGGSTSGGVGGATPPDTGPPTGGSSGSGGGSSEGGPPGGAGGLGPGGVGGVPASGGNGGSGGTLACKADAECTDPKAFCDFALDDCGKAGPGICTIDNTGGCAGVTSCGCDGVVYTSGCDAHAKGTDLGPAAGCVPPPTLFPCDMFFCSVGAELCIVDKSGTGKCTKFTSCSATSNCDECKATLCPSGVCNKDAYSGYTLSCP